jgi:NagD protein
MTVVHLLDMDGVLVLGGQPIARSVDYVTELVARRRPFQILTNNSRFTPVDHAERLRAVGFPV